MPAESQRAQDFPTVQEHMEVSKNQRPQCTPETVAYYGKDTQLWDPQLVETAIFLKCQVLQIIQSPWWICRLGLGFRNMLLPGVLAALAPSSKPHTSSGLLCHYLSSLQKGRLSAARFQCPCDLYVTTKKASEHPCMSLQVPP